MESNPQVSLTSLADERERREVMEEIERLTASSRRRLGDEATADLLRQAPRGLFFPLFVNLVSLAMLVGGLAGAQWYFGQRQQEIRVRTEQEFSPEGRLVARLLEESQRRLREQQERIGQIQGDLERLLQERQGLENRFEAQLREREGRLRQELEAALNAERARLQQQGLSQAEIDRRLREFEAQRSRDIEQALEQARREAQREIEEREARLANLRNALEQARRSEEDIRRQLEAQAQGRVEALQTQLSEQAATLQRLAEERDFELNLFRQIEVALGEVRTALGVSQEEALAKLDTLDALLRASAQTASENLRRRLKPLQDASTALRETLGRLALRDAARRAEADPRLERLQNLVRQARAEPARRQELWTEALGLIEEVGEASQGIRTLEEQQRLARQQRREQERLEAIRQAFATLAPDNPTTWERLYEAIAPTDAAAYEVELRRGLRQAVERALEVARRPGEESLVRLNQTLEELTARNRALTERAEAAEQRAAQLEATVQALQNEITELRLASSGDEALSARLRQAEAEVGRLRAEMERLQRDRDGTSASLAEREATLARLERERSELLARVASLGEELQRARAVAGDREELSRQVEELRVLQDRVETLRRAYAQALEQALQRLGGVRSQEELDAARRQFAEQVSGSDAIGLLPRLSQLLDAVTAGQARLLVKPEEAAQARRRALEDVLKLTRFLEGRSERAAPLSAELRSLSLSDPVYAEVVSAVQRLAMQGAEEKPISLERWRLLGTVISAVGERLNIEILAGGTPISAGLKIQVRRAGSLDEVLGEGTISSVSGRRAIGLITNRREGVRLPIGGDVVWVEIP